MKRLDLIRSPNTRRSRPAISRTSSTEISPDISMVKAASVCMFTVVTTCLLQLTTSKNKQRQIFFCESRKLIEFRHRCTYRLELSSSCIAITSSAKAFCMLMHSWIVSRKSRVCTLLLIRITAVQQCCHNPEVFIIYHITKFSITMHQS